jgi:O-antigen/teichoic acid export membrane protein
MEKETERNTESDGLAAKTVKGSAYSIGASAVTMVLGFGRSVLMARLLAPEDFGTVAFALTLVNFTMPLRNFGIDQALIHRRPEDEESLRETLTTHFFLRLALLGLFLLLLVAAIPALRFFYPHKTMLVPLLLVLTTGEVARALGATPTVFLQKEMRFKELAILQLLTSLSMTIAGPLTAWQGLGIWAIVVERVSGLVVATIAVWTITQPWHMYLRFNTAEVKWYLNYGKFVFADRILGNFYQEFDDFWIGTTLGELALGFYSKAYEFALYPRRIISDPLTRVVFPLFAKLQDNRLQLSKAYFRFCSLVTRTSFLLAGALIISTYEFVSVLLGDRWLPVVTTFQLMIIYVLLDPLLIIGINLAQATGHPNFWTRARLVQVIFFTPAVIVGNLIWQINGVALAADVALLIGLILLFLRNRRLVDISFRRLFAFPTLGFSLGLVITWRASAILTFESQIITGLLKIIIFASVYSIILLVTETRAYAEHLRTILMLVTKKR